MVAGAPLSSHTVVRGVGMEALNGDLMLSLSSTRAEPPNIPPAGGPTIVGEFRLVGGNPNPVEVVGELRLVGVKPNPVDAVGE